LRRALVAIPVVLAALAAAGAVIGPMSATAAGLVLLAYLYAGLAATRTARWRWLLPLAGTLSYLVLPLVGVAVSIALLLVFGEPVPAAPLMTGAAAALAIDVLGFRLVWPRARVRIGVIGSPQETLRLAEELAASGNREYEVAATITPDDWKFDPASLTSPYLCSLADVGRAIDERDLGILVITREFPRELVHERLAREVITRPVQLMELVEFHEHRFGAVPIAELDYAWFTRLAGVHSRPGRALVKRLVDIAVVLSVLVALAPVIAIMAVLIKRHDGGPVLFAQERVGYGGAPFRIFKLRTMGVAPPGESHWTVSDDDRITPVGRFLRKTHLDEYPQLWNILRGDMSLVGPRPEQVGYVAELSEQIPFYNQRHLVKPGLTGWAQVRVGYAGSLRGTLFKVCNDLWYLKHHALTLDLVILAETVRTLVGDRQFVDDPVTSRTLAGEGDRALLRESDLT
jgi:exopolysaccharide biosynthesis polyprenyl glycosylphosphotransferase